MTNFKLTLLSLAVVASGVLTSVTRAESPDLKTPAPVIYLSDNLDEVDKLGWCIDTVGRGLGDKLHAHSCKPRGGDVQFSYNAESMQIASATYENKCAVIDGEIKADTKLGLVEGDAEVAVQQFVFKKETGAFHPKSDQSLCLAVGESSRSAGPFLSRDLALASCEETDAKFTHWTIIAAEA
jgi:hypothetical protein